MRLLGTVQELHPRGTFSFVKVSETEKYFAHVNEFKTPELMKLGQKVTFVPAPTHRGPAAFQIEAA